MQKLSLLFPRLTLIIALIVLQSMSSPSVQAASTDTAVASRSETVFFLLHGLASTSSTSWNELSEKHFGSCTKTSLTTPVTAVSNCYRHDFADRTVNKHIWASGDGATFQQLGDEVGLIVDQIETLIHPKAIILVGHSRGGLAARAYLQGLNSAPPFQLGLLTIGSPHQGSPFGRVQYWLTEIAGYQPEDVAFGDVFKDSDIVKYQQELLFSPSAGYLASAHNAQLEPTRNSVSESIWTLNDDIAKLASYTKTIGQITSDGYRLGESSDAGFLGNIDLLDDDSVLTELLIKGDFIKLRQFILQNIGRLNSDGDTWTCTRADKRALTKRGWACNTDSTVPSISQRLNKIAGFAPSANEFHQLPEKQRLHRVVHTDEPDQILPIKRMLKTLKADIK